MLTVADTAAQSFDVKAFDAAVSLAQSLTQWGFLIIAGSVVILVGTSYYRPRHTLTRASYLSFLIAWFLMGMSIYKGIQVQMANVARLFQTSASLSDVRHTMTHDANQQIKYMEYSLIVFGLWLVLFSFWWIFHKAEPEPPPAAAPLGAPVK